MTDLRLEKGGSRLQTGVIEAGQHKVTSVEHSASDRDPGVKVKGMNRGGIDWQSD